MAVNPRLRRKGRERALQFLYGLDFTQYDWRDVLEAFWTNNPTRRAARDYAEVLIQGVCEHQEELDAQLRAHLERWSPERVGHIERNCIRIALYEMQHRDDVPASVAINEAVDVAKQFGAENAPRFVNGILDRIRRDLQAADGTTE